MISGFYKPDSGRILLEDRDITRRKPSEVAALGIARTFQNIALFSGLTVLDNLMLGRHVRMRAGVFGSAIYWGMAQREEIANREVCEELIDFLKLQDLRKQQTGALAYGLRKRVELGRALALEPSVILLDEPMGGMNQDEKEDMARYILDVNQERGVSVVLIEHDREAEVLVDAGQEVPVARVVWSARARGDDCLNQVLGVRRAGLVVALRIGPERLRRPASAVRLRAEGPELCFIESHGSLISLMLNLRSL